VGPGAVQVAELRQQVQALQAVVGYAPDADDAGAAGTGAAPAPAADAAGERAGAGGNGAGGGGAGGNGAGGAHAPGQEARSGLGSGSARSLEALLLGKARRLEHELTMAKLRIAEACGAPRRAPRPV
jgi:hypothetical protein